MLSTKSRPSITLVRWWCGEDHLVSPQRHGPGRSSSCPGPGAQGVVVLLSVAVLIWKIRSLDDLDARWLEISGSDRSGGTVLKLNVLKHFSWTSWNVDWCFVGNIWAGVLSWLWLLTLPTWQHSWWCDLASSYSIYALEVFSLDYWQFQCPKSKVTCMYQRPSFCETLHGNAWHCTVWAGFRGRRAYDSRQTENKVSFSTVRDATRQALNTFHTNALVNSSDTCILLLPDFCVALQHDGDLMKFQNQLRWNWLSMELWLKFTISSERENIGIHTDTIGYLIFPTAMLSCLMASG